MNRHRRGYLSIVIDRVFLPGKNVVKDKVVQAKFHWAVEVGGGLMGQTVVVEWRKQMRLRRDH